MKRIAPLSVVGCLGLLFAASACFAQMYTSTDLGTLGGTTSVGLGINNAGQVVGHSYPSGNTSYHAFRTAPDSPINPATDDLGTLGRTVSYADGINDYGQVVGYSATTGIFPEHAFLYSGGVMYDLNTLIPVDSGWERSVAYGINDAGQIVVGGVHNCSPSSCFWHAFLLTPIYKALGATAHQC